MNGLKVGDVVARKSYGGDIYFRIDDISVGRDGKNAYSLRGIIYRIFADAREEDLVLRDSRQVQQHMRTAIPEDDMQRLSRGRLWHHVYVQRSRGKPGNILHIDSSQEYLNMCVKYYKDAGIRVYGHVIPESEQPQRVRSLLSGTGADILIVTGHDGIKKETSMLNSLDNYRNSRYFIRSVNEARRFEPSSDKLCIFAGACQSYYEGIMDAGANFASSPGRILIHALDPAKVGDRVSLTDSRAFVTPSQIAKITKSGSEGIGGIKTRGHYIAG